MSKKNKLEIIPEPADLTYEFFDESEKVGICHGNIYENDIPIAYYCCYTFFDSGKDLELFVGLKRGTDSYLILAVKCTQGSTDEFRVIDPLTLRWEFNNSLDFNNYSFLQPDNWVDHEQGQKAYALIQEIIHADEGIFDYLDGGVPAYSINKISSCGSLGIITKDTFPFNYVIWSLQFLSLSKSELEDYIQHDFGDIEITCERNGSPLEAHFLDCYDWLPYGSNWNDWIHSPNLMDRTIEREFKALTRQFKPIIEEWIFDVKIDNLKVQNDEDGFLMALTDCRSQTNDILEKLGWTDRKPVMNSQNLLSEYSWDR